MMNKKLSQLGKTIVDVAVGAKEKLFGKRKKTRAKASGSAAKPAAKKKAAPKKNATKKKR